MKRNAIKQEEAQPQYEDTNEGSKTETKAQSPPSDEKLDKLYDEDPAGNQKQLANPEINVETESRESNASNLNEWNSSTAEEDETDPATASTDNEETDAYDEREGRILVEVTPENVNRLLSYASPSVRDQVQVYIAQLLNTYKGEDDDVATLSGAEAPIGRAARRIDSGTLSAENSLTGKYIKYGKSYIGYAGKKLKTASNEYFLDFPKNEDGDGGPGKGNLWEIMCTSG